MVAQADRSEITLASMDEAGFSLAPPKLSAWTPVGKCHMINSNLGKHLNYKAKLVRPILKGLKLYFLPVYSQKLNRIEKFWHKMKYELMEFKTRNTTIYEENVDQIFNSFEINYGMTFS
jgi:hypothetical protein